MDHHGLDAAFDTLNVAISANDALETACATAAFKFHLDIHLDQRCPPVPAHQGACVHP